METSEILEEAEDLEDWRGMSSQRTSKNFILRIIKVSPLPLLLCVLRSPLGDMDDVDVWMRAEHARYQIWKRNIGFITCLLLDIFGCSELELTAQYKIEIIERHGRGVYLPDIGFSWIPRHSIEVCGVNLMVIGVVSCDNAHTKQTSPRWRGML